MTACNFSNVEVGEYVRFTANGTCDYCGERFKTGSLSGIYRGHISDNGVKKDLVTEIDANCPNCSRMFTRYLEVCHEDGSGDALAESIFENIAQDNIAYIRK